MSTLESQQDPSAIFTFNSAEQIFAADMPPYLKARLSPEAEVAKREYIYHFLAAKFANEGGLEAGDPDAPSEIPVIKKTLKEWHGLWADALTSLIDGRSSNVTQSAPSGQNEV